MKKRITDDHPFTCRLCLKPNNTLNGLLNHVRKKHDCEYDYYMNYIKSEKDGVCKCSYNTKFISPKRGYDKLCYRCKKEKRKRDKAIQAQNFKKKYGVNNPAQVKEIYDKIKNTNLERYGCTCTLQNKTIIEKIKRNNIKKYGVEYPIQSKKILHKQQISSCSKKKFKNTNIWYQGSYELDFLEKYYEKFPDIQRGPSIKYIFENTEKVYYPDFFIPSLNLIIEIKGSYWKKENKNKAQQISVERYYDYIMILDKNYNRFNIYTTIKT